MPLKYEYHTIILRQYSNRRVLVFQRLPSYPTTKFELPPPRNAAANATQLAQQRQQACMITNTSYVIPVRASMVESGGDERDTRAIRLRTSDRARSVCVCVRTYSSAVFVKILHAMS